MSNKTNMILNYRNILEIKYTDTNAINLNHGRINILYCLNATFYFLTNYHIDAVCAMY